MEGNSMSGGGGAMLPGMASGILSLEIPPLHQHHHLPHQQQPQQQHHLLSFSAHQDQQNPNYPYSSKPKQQQQQHQPPLSDEDDPGFPADDGSGDAAKKRVSPWQRMKWKDSMVRLLIMVVFYIGDDYSAAESTDPKKKPGGGSGGALQKKGKWKSVSRAMMEKGFYVSPQQCEDKFNDLNKRYKRVNDILGKGTACRVVENQALLQTMDHLSPKMKEEVKKLLNSKHLFFREMCAYHNTQQQERCFHSSDAAHSRTIAAVVETEEIVKHGEEEEEHDDDDDDDDDEEEEEEEEDEDEEDEDENEDDQEVSRGHEEDEHVQEDFNKRKRTRDCGSSIVSVAMKQLRCELMGVLEDGTKSQWEQRHWVMRQLVQLEEQQVSYHCQALELEKNRLKWFKFSNKKEREMERLKIKNERNKLENQRMLLLLKQKEIELLPSPSSPTTFS